MKLFYSPGACSLSPHIALQETQQQYELVCVDLSKKLTEQGADYKAINIKGGVPAIQLESGEVLTEGPAIVQYIADQKPDAGLIAKPGTMERYRQQEALNFITSDLHKGIGTLFAGDLSDSAKTELKARLKSRFELVENQLKKQPYIAGQNYSVADGYLFTVLRWCTPLNIDLSDYPTIQAYQQKIAQRPAVQAAMKAEGIA